MILGLKIDKTYHPIKNVTGFYFEDGFCIVHHENNECIFNASDVAFVVHSVGFETQRMIPFLNDTIQNYNLGQAHDWV